MQPFLSLTDDPPEQSRHLSLAAARDQVVAQQAHRNELKLAYVRLLVLLISLALDVVVFFNPVLLGKESVPPTVILISLSASLVSLGLIRALHQTLALNQLRRWQVVAPGFDGLLLGAFITNIWQVLGESQPLILCNIVAFCCLLAVSGGMRFTRQATLLTTVLSLVNFAYAAWRFELNVALALFTSFTILGTGLVGLWMSNILRRHVKNEMGRMVMERFLPPTVVEAAFETPLQLLQQPQRRDVTVLMTDLRGFTQFAETLDPQAVMAMLTRYQDMLVTLVERHGGWVDKFMGDGMLAVFGAPDLLDDHAEKALAAALAILHESRLVSPLGLGAGLHSGPVVAGCVGTANRIDFTVLGDTVNVASRLEAMTKDYPQSPILISQETAQRIHSRPLRPLGSHPIRGRGEPIILYTLTEEDFAHLPR